MSTNTPQPPATQVISPKVIASTIAAVIGPATAAGIDAIVAGDLLMQPLGAWAPVAYAVISSVSAWIAGYLVRDPRRV